MKNRYEKILMAEEEIKQLQNKKPSTKCCALPSPAPKSWSQTKPPTSSNNNTKKSYSRVTTSKTPISTWHKSKTASPKPYRKRKRGCCGTTAFTALPSANLLKTAAAIAFSDGLKIWKGYLKNKRGWRRLALNSKPIPQDLKLPGRCAEVKPTFAF